MDNLKNLTELKRITITFDKLAEILANYFLNTWIYSKDFDKYRTIVTSLNYRVTEYDDNGKKIDIIFYNPKISLKIISNSEIINQTTKKGNLKLIK